MIIDKSFLFVAYLTIGLSSATIVGFVIRLNPVYGQRILVFCGLMYLGYFIITAMASRPDVTAMFVLVSLVITLGSLLSGLY